MNIVANIKSILSELVQPNQQPNEPDNVSNDSNNVSYDSNQIPEKVPINYPEIIRNQNLKLRNLMVGRNQGHKGRLNHINKILLIDGRRII